MSGTVQDDAVRSDAIAVLAEDHRRMRQLFEEFESLPPKAYVLKSKVAARMIDLITVHTFLRREVLYPRLGTLVPGVDGELDSLRAQHREAEHAAVELWTMRPEDARFADRAGVLIARVREHMDAQEDHWFPRLADTVPPADLDALGAELVRARRRAPASPRVGS